MFSQKRGEKRMGWNEGTTMERLLVILVFWLVSAIRVLIFEKKEMKKYIDILKSDIEIYRYFLNKQRSSETTNKVVCRDIPDNTLEAVKNLLSILIQIAEAMEMIL